MNNRNNIYLFYVDYYSFILFNLLLNNFKFVFTNKIKFLNFEKNLKFTSLKYNIIYLFINQRRV